MHSLQDLYDFFIQTMPSRGKVKSATTLLIHITKAMQVSSTEEIMGDELAEIPYAIDRFYKTSPTKALQDKSVLAEMIGRYGPKDGWEKAFDILLEDPDENLRQFTLYSIEYIADTDPDLLISYIRLFMDSDDLLLKNIAAHLASRLLCGKHHEQMKKMVASWLQDGNVSFLEEMKRTLEICIRRKEKLNQHEACQTAYEWLNSKLGHAA